MEKELAHRDTDGISVTLFWHSGTNRLSVSVYDRRNGDWFEVAAGARNAMDVFEHPYAYRNERRSAAEREPVYA
jgi:hypothetical protein